MDTPPTPKHLQAHNLPLICVGAGIIFWFGLYFSLYALDWPGEAHPCSIEPYCFCETAIKGALAAQPSNTWSDLGFVFAAIFIAFHGRKKLIEANSTGRENGSATVYQNNALIIALYSSAILYMGPGSMFFHGAMTQWGGMMDVISMFVFVLFVTSYLIYRSWNTSRNTFYFTYIFSTLVVILIAIFLHNFASVLFRYVAGLLIALALIQVIPINKLSLGRKQDLHFNHKWMIAALSFFGVAVVIWSQSDSGGPLCYPDSLLQGHAAWHLLSAAMTVSIHFYLLSDKSKTI